MTSTSVRPGGRLATALAYERGAWQWTLLVAFITYAFTAHWQSGQVNDAQAAIWPAWQLVNTGTLDLSGAANLPNLPWFGEVDGRIVSYRTMGVLLSGIPFALLTWPFGLDAEQVGALTATTYTALAIANMHLVFRTIVSPGLAAVAALTLALGSPLWTTAAAELWTHGPGAFWISCAILALTRGRMLVAGAALAPAIMVRPHLAVAAACFGLTLTWAARSVRPALLIGVPAASALPILYLWNGWYYGTGNVGGAYQGHVTSALAAPGGSNTALFLKDAAGAFVAPDVGLLLYSPLVALLLLLVPRGWSQAPAWARGALLGGIVYQVVQLRVNRYTGGGGFYSNRLVVEFIVLSAPVWLLGLRSWMSSRRRVAWASALAGTGVGIHAFGAVNAYYWRGTSGDWWIWYPKVVLDAMGTQGYLVAGCLSVIPLLFVRVAGRSPGSTISMPAQVASQEPEPGAPSSGEPAPPPGAAASTRR